jgi:hypothetical protein
MLRHVATFRWTDSTTGDDIAAVEEGLAALPAAIPQIKVFRFGRDAGINEGAYDFAVVADFETVDDYLVYRDHPTHQALLVERIAPQVATRAAIQFEW